MRQEIIQQARASVGNNEFTVSAGETLIFPETDIRYFELQVRSGAEVISSSFYLEEPGQVPEKGVNYIEPDFNKSAFESRLRQRLLQTGRVIQ